MKRICVNYFNFLYFLLIYVYDIYIHLCCQQVRNLSWVRNLRSEPANEIDHREKRPWPGRMVPLSVDPTLNGPTCAPALCTETSEASASLTDQTGHWFLI
jgi:hypothetical protein